MMNAQKIISKLNASHTDDDATSGLTTADVCAGGQPAENNGNGWFTLTGTLYPTLASIPWQARGSARPAMDADYE